MFMLFSVSSSAHLLALVDENGSLVIYNTNRYGEDALLKGFIFTLTIRTPQLHNTILVLKFEQVQFTTRSCV